LGLAPLKQLSKDNLNPSAEQGRRLRLIAVTLQQEVTRSLYQKEKDMDTSTLVRIAAGVFAAVIAAVIVVRRKRSA